MADNLDLAIRIQTDLKSALRGLGQMERGVDDVGCSMKRASSLTDTFGRAVSRLVSGDLVARGLVTLGRAVQRFAADSVRAGIEAESLARSMRMAIGGGSSPLARGTPLDQVGTGMTFGLIPARAGNTAPGPR